MEADWKIRSDGEVGLVVSSVALVSHVDENEVVVVVVLEGYIRNVTLLRVRVRLNIEKTYGVVSSDIDGLLMVMWFIVGVIPVVCQ